MMQTEAGRRPPSTQRKMTRLTRLGTRRLTRAHVTLGERPQVARLAHQALGAMCEALGQELGSPVTATARLLEAVITPEAALAHSGAFALLDLSARGGRAVLEVESSVLLAALARLAGASPRPGPVTYLTRLEEATFAYLVLSALAALRAQGALHERFGPRLCGVTMERAEALAALEARQPHVGVEVMLTVGACTAGARLVLPAVELEAGLKELPVERPADIAPQVLAARVPALCRVGRVPLPRDAFTAIEVGDVIFFEDVRREGERLLGPGRLLTRGFELAGDLLSEGFSLNRARTRALAQELDMVAMNERPEALPPMPVEVEIELTRVMLPLSELAALKPGALLPLHINASEPVLLRVGDRAVARAELVEIDGEVGARILTLLP